jgi:hypothetical protein
MSEMTKEKAKAGKAKGTRGEREIVALIGVLVGRVFESYGMPRPVISRSKRGCDVDGLLDYAFEVKRDNKPRLEDDCLAWAQVEAFAKAKGKIPVLFYRSNNSKWRVKIQTVLVVPLAITCGSMTIVDISLESFCTWFEADLHARMRSKLDAIKGMFK